MFDDVALGTPVASPSATIAVRRVQAISAVIITVRGAVGHHDAEVLGRLLQEELPPCEPPSARIVSGQDSLRLLRWRRPRGRRPRWRRPRRPRRARGDGRGRAARARRPRHRRGRRTIGDGGGSRRRDHRRSARSHSAQRSSRTGSVGARRTAHPPSRPTRDAPTALRGEARPLDEQVSRGRRLTPAIDSCDRLLPPVSPTDVSGSGWGPCTSESDPGAAGAQVLRRLSSEFGEPWRTCRRYSTPTCPAGGNPRTCRGWSRTNGVPWRRQRRIEEEDPCS